MSFVILLAMIIVSSIFCELLDGVPDLLLAALHPPGCFWGGAAVLLLAWLSSEN